MQRPTPLPFSPMAKSTQFPSLGRAVRCTLGALWLLLPGALQAGAVNWNSSLFQTNLTSVGAALDDSFVFELGAFDLTGGFVPTSANTDQWAARWRPVQRNFYNPTTRLFSGSYEVTSNASPFATNEKGYIWGHHCSGQAGQSILLQSSNWKWPLVGGTNPAVAWTVGNSQTPIVGQINGSGYHMRTSAVGANPLPPISPTDWRSLRFSPAEVLNPSVSGWNADPDFDGMSNLLEYATGRNPKSATRVWVPLPEWQISGASRYLKLSVPQCAYSQTSMVIEVSGNLQNWFSGPSDVEMLPGSGDNLMVRDLTASTAAARRYIRARVSVP